MKPEIRAPIFVVGVPRSGTGALAWRMSRHPDVARITQVTKKTAPSWLLTRLLMLFRHDHTITEGGRIWGKFCSPEHQALGRQQVTPRARRYLRKVVRLHLRIFDKPRFLAKCPANTLRIGFLDEIFPTAIFVHIIRDGRAVTRSIYRNFQKHDGYWGLELPGGQDLHQLPWLVAAALQWKRGIEFARGSAADLPPERYLEVRYEDFCESPLDVLEDVSGRCGLEWARDHLEEVVSEVESRNYKWREQFDGEQIRRIEELQGGLLAELGYEV